MHLSRHGQYIVNRPCTWLELFDTMSMHISKPVWHFWGVLLLSCCSSRSYLSRNFGANGNSLWLPGLYTPICGRAVYLFWWLLDLWGSCICICKYWSDRCWYISPGSASAGPRLSPSSALARPRVSHCSAMGQLHFDLGSALALARSSLGPGSAPAWSWHCVGSAPA